MKLRDVNGRIIKDENNRVEIPIPSLKTIIVMILLFILIIPWIWVLLKSNIINRIDDYFSSIVHLKDNGKIEKDF